MWLILSPQREGFVQPDNWTADLEKAYPFPTKIDALDFVRADITKDQEAEVVPRFTACRVVELKQAAISELLRRGLKARERGDGIALEIGSVMLTEVRAKWPQRMYGFPIVLVRGKDVVPWGAPKLKDRVVDFLKRKR